MHSRSLRPCSKLAVSSAAAPNKIKISLLHEAHFPRGDEQAGLLELAAYSSRAGRKCTPLKAGLGSGARVTIEVSLAVSRTVSFHWAGSSVGRAFDF